MPCYNSRDTVARAVRSVINQTFERWELIVVNDGSTDDTVEIIKKTCREDGRIKILSKQNGGYVSAVNFGLDHITGEYFILLGSDDELNVGLFENLASFCEAKKPDMIGFGTVIKSGEEEKPDENTEYGSVVEEYGTDFKTFCRKWKDKTRILATRDTSKAYRSSLLSDLRYFGRSGMDADGVFSMLFARKCASFVLTPYVGYYWYLHADSLSGRKKTKATQTDRMKTWNKFFEEVVKTDISETDDYAKAYLFYFYKVIVQTFVNYRFLAEDKELMDESRKTIKRCVDLYGLSCPCDMKLFLKKSAFWGIACRISYYFGKIKKKLRRIY